MSGSHIEHDVHSEHDAHHEPHAHAQTQSRANGTDHANGADGLAHDAETGDMSNTVMATVATVGVVGVAAVVFEAALIPGMVLGVAAALAPSYVPRFGAAFNPLLRSGMRGAFKFGQKTREMMSEAREHMNDIAAEVAAEGDKVSAGPVKSERATA